MADKEKSSGKIHPATPIIILIVVLLLLSSLLYRIEQYLYNNAGVRYFFRQLWLFFNGQASLESVVGYTGSAFLISLLFVFKVLAILASVAMIWLIFKTLKKLTAVNEKVWAKLKQPKAASGENWKGEETIQYINPKWHKVQVHINSKNPGDWRLAILEADIILDEMLDKMGYHGATIGEKLKMVEPSDFNTINNAWEAHKIRNSIAHEGSDFLISEREANRVIALFKTVFEEFKYI